MTSLYNNSVSKYYDYLMTDLADPRTNHWFLISDPFPVIAVLIAYLYFVLNWGPKYMAHRKPFELTNTLVIYNLFQVIASIYLFYEGLDAAWLSKYSWKCQPVDTSNTHDAMRVASGCYLYFLAKITELLDTVFFVLRKKERQISFLHMYHHTVMPMISWGATKYYPGGHGTFIGFINCFVHIIMYSYYMLAAMGPKYQKYVWWKKHITTLQMLQFCLAFLHSSQLIFYDCGYPRWSVCLTLPNAIFFYFLFDDFYNKSYQVKPEQSGAVTNGHSNGKTPALSNGKITSSNQKNENENDSNGKKKNS